MRGAKNIARLLNEKEKTAKAERAREIKKDNQEKEGSDDEDK
jgi:hypothetical protein